MAQSQRRTIVDSIVRLSRRGATRNLQKIFERVRPADIALIFAEVGEDQIHALFELIQGTDRQAETLNEAIPELQRKILGHLEDWQIIELLDRLAADDGADLLALLPEDRSDAILKAWKSPESAHIDILMAYDAGSAGGIMSPDFFALPKETTIEEAVKTLQVSHHDLEMVFYLYVVNEIGQLYGVCSLRQLVVSPPEHTLADICVTDLITSGLDDHQEDVAHLVARYNLLAIPVIDTNNVLAGIVTVDDVIDVIREEATEDIFKMSGTHPDAFEDTPSVGRSLRARMPWLFASFVTGLLSMIVIAQFRDEITRVALLAAFIPVILGMGGNAGTQSATLMVRSIALGRVSNPRIARVIGREILVGVLSGIFYGVVLAAITWMLFRGDARDPVWTIFQLSSTVAISVLCCMSVATALGVSIPILFHRVGIDPAVATNPLVTTTTDVVGAVIYFIVAMFLLPL